MTNYVTEQDFQVGTKDKKSIVVTTQYGRADSWIPFLNSVVLNKLKHDNLISVEKIKGAYTYKVTFNSSF